MVEDLPTKGEVVIHGPGENAGAIDIGDGKVAIFKIESHNHPSFIEPIREQLLVLVEYSEMFLQWAQDL